MDHKDLSLGVFVGSEDLCLEIIGFSLEINRSLFMYQEIFLMKS